MITGSKPRAEHFLFNSFFFHAAVLFLSIYLLVWMQREEGIVTQAALTVSLF
jgi:hypothetical protein